MTTETWHDLVYKHDNDLYRGDPPGTGLTTRMALVENNLDKQSKNLNKLMWVALSTLLAVVIEVIKIYLLK